MSEATDERFERTQSATLRTLVQYAGASGDFYEMHYDLPFARQRGHAELSVHGLLKAAWLGQLVDDWFGGRGRIVSFEVTYRGMDFRDQPVTCGGEVARREGSLVELALWTKNAAGATTTTGAALIELHDASRSDR